MGMLIIWFVIDTLLTSAIMEPTSASMEPPSVGCQDPLTLTGLNAMCCKNRPQFKIWNGYPLEMTVTKINILKSLNFFLIPHIAMLALSVSVCEEITYESLTKSAGNQ